MLTTDRFAHVQSCRALWCEHLKELNLGSRFILHNGDVSLAKGKGFLSWLSCPAAERKRWLFKGDSCYLYSKMVTNAYPSFKQDPFTETIGLGGRGDSSILSPDCVQCSTPTRRESERRVWAGGAGQPVAAPTSEFHHPHDVLPTGVTAGILYPQGELRRSPPGNRRLVTVKHATSAPDWLACWTSRKAKCM